MTTWTIVPVKDFQAAKRRLAERIGEAERRSLAIRLASRTFDLLAECGLRQVVVVAGCAQAAGLAREHGFEALRESGNGHSAAVAQAMRWCVGQRADAVATVATDLPLMCADDVIVLHSAIRPHRLVLAPDRRGVGTNALAVAPPSFTFHFGPDSFRRHLREAEERQLETKVLRLPGLALDLDSASDFDMLVEARQLPL